MNVWWLMVTCGIVTFLIRFSFIGAEGRWAMPSWFRSALPFVPIAALTALVAPELLLVSGKLALIAENSRLWAGVLAIGVAAIWRNTLLTIAAGFAAFAVLRAII